MTIADLELERIAALGWQAEHRRWLGEWLLRANDGFTVRANSILPLGDPGRPVGAALEEAADWYEQFGLPLRVTVPSPACDELGRALDARGWDRGVLVRVMVADLTDPPIVDDPAGPARVDVRPASSLAWQAAYRHGTDRDLPAAGRRLLVRGDVVAFAQVLEGDEPVAIGRGTVVDGCLGLTAVHVAPHRRRRGLARQIVSGLVAWARGRGAECAYLQVAASNGAATALYGRLGFVDHHTYVHMSAPA